MSDEVPILLPRKAPVANNERIQKHHKRKKEQVDGALEKSICLFLVSDTVWVASGKINSNFDKVDELVTWMKEKSTLTPSAIFADMQNHEDVLRRLGKACKFRFFLINF